MNSASEGRARRVVLFAAFAALLAAAWTSAAAAPYEVADERGVAVRFAAPPQRVVSLLPSLTETVCALGACDRLVGVDRDSNWPERVKALPQLGGGIDPNVEAIVRARPDVVLLARSSRQARRLQSLGVRIVVLEPRNHADVRRVLGLVGRVLAVPSAQADAVWRDIQAGVARAAASVPERAKKARVYIEVSRGPYAASEASFIGETLALLGAKNIVPAALGPFPKLNPEYV
ncbi:MAG: ABC transporter substrate-binding protein, partial [Variovorax sp.]